MLTQDRLKVLVNYCQDTGKFTWNLSRRRCAAGAPAGCRMSNGYICIRLDNVLHFAHRLAWLYMAGKWPANQIDHINGDRADNRFCNLREATNAENAQNRRRTNNRTGFTGVHKEGSKWKAEIKVNYKTIRIGRFESPEEAHKAYIKYKNSLHPFSQN